MGNHEYYTREEEREYKQMVGLRHEYNRLVNRPLRTGVTIIDIAFMLHGLGQYREDHDAIKFYTQERINQLRSLVDD